MHVLKVAILLISIPLSVIYVGYTLREIAGEKAGIFKKEVPAFTSPQEGEAMLSLQKRADELEVSSVCLFLYPVFHVISHRLGVTAQA